MVKLNNVENNQENNQVMRNSNNKEVMALEQNHFKIFNIEKQIVELTEVSPRQSLVVINCNELVIKVPNTINHIDISNSRNIHLIFKSVISFIEITRSYNVKIEASGSFHTLQIDMSDSIYIPVRESLKNQIKVVSEGSTNIFLEMEKEKEVHTIEFQDTQSVTYFDNTTKGFKTVSSESLKKDGSNFILLSSL